MELSTLLLPLVIGLQLPRLLVRVSELPYLINGVLAILF